MSRRKKIPDLALAVDFGGSGTKVFYALRNGDSLVGSFLMEPEVGRVPRQTLSGYEKRKFTSGLPENEAWVGVGDEYAVVGYLAVSQSLGLSSLSLLKSEQAVSKFLAALWVVYKRRPQLGKKFKLMATVLLPGGEYAERERLKRDLKAALASFETPDGQFCVELLSLGCLPEGAGIYLGYRGRAPESFSQERIGFLMLGYRNASFLFSERGAVASVREQADLGMVRLIERVKSRTSGLDAKRLSEAVFEAGESAKRDVLWKVCRSRSASRRSEEVEGVMAAVRLARQEYVNLLWSWIDEVLPPRVERLVFSGGTTDYLRSEIESVYTVTPVVFHGGLVVPQKYVAENWASRFVDVWAVFLGLLTKLKQDYGLEIPLEISSQ
jgi:hypothetical protein